MKERAAPVTRTKTWLWIAAGVLLGLGLGAAAIVAFTAGQLMPWRAAPGMIPPAVPQVNTPARNFSLNTLDGKPVSLADFSGKTVLLNFWATWCGPCRAEMPLLQQFQDRYPDRLAVLAVNDGEGEDLVRAFVAEMGLKLGILLDPERQVIEAYRVRGFPTTYIIDPAGVIRYQHIGVLSQDTLTGYLSELGFQP